ncbi:hypothetical protein BC939DRAFT_462071 [Gamsiella multidivaricata]|uniref:uncharacterized protein n=1 Tax=Gamsiella multidivaricata TaxID=101098 RepID=UPI00221EA7FB|nr:uncharacterized protein BC939DRAFT_462071 [Gamsiella multidivaricata]KAI7818818.1 hypothetical protein BC939DRAFT_462071 [Gamsiella multidivaricata]
MKGDKNRTMALMKMTNGWLDGWMVGWLDCTFGVAHSLCSLFFRFSALDYEREGK